MWDFGCGISDFGGGLGDECRQSRLEGRAGDTGIGCTAGERINRRLDRDAVGVADDAGNRQSGGHRIGVGDQTDTIAHSGAVNQGTQRGLEVGALAIGEAGGAVNHDLKDRVAIAESGEAGDAGSSTVPDDIQLVPGGRLAGGQLNRGSLTGGGRDSGQFGVVDPWATVHRPSALRILRGRTNQGFPGTGTVHPALGGVIGGCVVERGGEVKPVQVAAIGGGGSI